MLLVKLKVALKWKTRLLKKTPLAEFLLFCLKNGNCFAINVAAVQLCSLSELSVLLFSVEICLPMHEIKLTWHASPVQHLHKLSNNPEVGTRKKWLNSLKLLK